MGTQYVCTNERRRQAVRNQTVFNGIDYLEVLDGDAPVGSPPQHTLLVRCINPLGDPPPPLGDPPPTAKNVSIEGGVRVTNVKVVWASRASDAADLLAKGLISAIEANYFLAQPDPDRLLVVRTDSRGDYSTYRLRLIKDTGSDLPYGNFDRLLFEVDFSFKVECPSEFDCQVKPECPPETAEVPPIDYLAKDYASFRRLLLDRLAVIMPDWKDRSVPDLGIAVVEVLAYVADYLSFYQDAAATEAYLGTARRRPSVRRHARLLDYNMHDGCNARAWVHICLKESSAADGQTLVRRAAGTRTRLLTTIPKATVLASEDFDDLRLDFKPEVFELMYDHTLYEAHNKLRFYTWGDRECCLPKGATCATLLNNETMRLRLRPGDVLIFEEVKGPGTGAASDADPAHRHAVRLTQVIPEATLVDVNDPTGPRDPASIVKDELLNKPIVEIEWMEADALPFPLCLSTVAVIDGQEKDLDDVSLVRGNIVLADHGRTIGELDDEDSLEELDEATGGRFYRPALDEADVTHSEAFDADAWVAFDASSPSTPAASDVLEQDPRDALPVVALLDDDAADWSPQRDLFGSDRFDTHFVVEIENNGDARLRFGDNTYSKKPGAGQQFLASYRVGNGTAGNIGAGALAHLVVDGFRGIAEVRNPLPASGGVDPEDLEEVRQYAPQAFRRQERAVTTTDYADVAERHRAVDRAAATRCWTGSWHTMFVTVDRTGGAEVDQDFEDELTDWIDQYKLAGHDVEIEPPELVPLDIAFTVCVEEGFLRSHVKQALFKVFSNRDLPDGRRGFFHPDNFTFGQAVYLSRIVAAAMEVPGVRYVAFDPEADSPARFQRWGQEPNDELDAGMITMGRLEIAQLDNDPSQPENGKIEFFMEGGL